jgi:hypothetical protein
MKTTFLLVFAACVTAYGQDAASMAAMQATQAAQMASQQAMQAAQMANQQAMQASQMANQQAMQAAQDSYSGISVARRPAFSVVPGAVAPGTKVRLKSSTRHAVIYYTTNGWTPTTASTRYTGPISIDSATHLQAVAIAPYCQRSLIAVADYTVIGQAPSAPEAAVSTNGLLRAGTVLRLVTGSAVNSKTAQVGDSLSLLLDEDVKDGDRVVIPKGAVVDATISAVDHSGHAGAPGDIAFEVHSLRTNGIVIPLRGGETLEGADKVNKVLDVIFIPVVGETALLVRGDEAQIKPGMTLTASVAADTPLHP